MKRQVLAGFAFVLVCDAAFSQPSGIQGASWLRGCWESSLPGGIVEEIWTTPKGGSMIGVSRTIRNGALADYEMIALREEGDRLAYVAHPSRQSPATFLSTRITASELLFENPAHDFPQQIGYRLNGDALLAWISGVQNGKPRRAEFAYKRVTCVGLVDGAGSGDDGRRPVMVAPMQPRPTVADEPRQTTHRRRWPIDHAA